MYKMSDSNCYVGSLHRDKDDPRDFIYEDRFKIRAPIFDLPKQFDLLYKTPKARSQGAKGACVAFVGCEAKSMLENNQDIMFSPDFLYHFSRVIEDTSYTDQGTTMRSMLKSLKRFGVCLEQLFPYRDDIVDREPTTNAILNAQNHKIDAYYRIKNGLYSIKSYLYNNRLPIAFGINVFESTKSQSVAKTGKIPIPDKDEKIIGQHGLLCVGYKDVTGVNKLASAFNHHKSSECYLVCLNSWGDYGKEGIVYLPVEFFTKNNYAYDFWIME